MQSASASLYRKCLPFLTKLNSSRRSLQLLLKPADPPATHQVDDERQDEEKRSNEKEDVIMRTSLDQFPQFRRYGSGKGPNRVNGRPRKQCRVSRCHQYNHCFPDCSSEAKNACSQHTRHSCG